MTATDKHSLPDGSVAAYHDEAKRLHWLHNEKIDGLQLPTIYAAKLGHTTSEVIPVVTWHPGIFSGLSMPWACFKVELDEIIAYLVTSVTTRIAEN
jgi:hypothetical protein